LHDNGIDFVRGVARVHTRSVFGLMSLASNIKVQPHALEDFVSKGKPLPPEAVSKLVGELFHGKARWDETTQSLADATFRLAPDARRAAQRLHRVAEEWPSRADYLAHARNRHTAEAMVAVSRLPA
jgi:hypothetical protein